MPRLFDSGLAFENKQYGVNLLACVWIDRPKNKFEAVSGNLKTVDQSQQLDVARLLVHQFLRCTQLQPNLGRLNRDFILINRIGCAVLITTSISTHVLVIEHQGNRGIRD